MSDKPSLKDVIKQLQVELLAAEQNSSGTGLSIAAAKVSIGFEVSQNESGAIALTASNEASASQLKLKFALQTTNAPSLELALVEDDSDTEDDLDEATDFAGFKKRFEANVKKKHGRIGSTKKNIFDDD